MNPPDPTPPPTEPREMTDEQLLDEEKVRADFADLAADNRGRVIESLEHQLSAANERLARLEAFAKSAAEYSGEGPPTTPWRDIVRDLSKEARAALSASTNNGRASEGK